MSCIDNNQICRKADSEIKAHTLSYIHIYIMCTSPHYAMKDTALNKKKTSTVENKLRKTICSTCET